MRMSDGSSDVCSSDLQDRSHNMTVSSSPTLQFLGAAGTVTGSRYLVEANGQRVLVDCGLFQGYKQLRDRNWAPFPVEPSSIDAVVLRSEVRRVGKECVRTCSSRLSPTH